MLGLGPGLEGCGLGLGQWRHSLLTRVDKVQGPPRSKGPPSATCKNLCHEIITDTLLTSDTLTISGECYDISNSNVQPKSYIYNAGLINLSVRILCVDKLHHFKDMSSLLCNSTDFYTTIHDGLCLQFCNLSLLKNLNALNW